MAETKKAKSRRSGSSKSNGSSSSARSGGSGSRAKSSKASSSKRAGGSSKSKATKSKSPARKKTAPQASSNGNGSGSADVVKDAVKNGAHGVADVARKAKVPLVASGAAVAGVAGAVVMSRTNKRRKVLGVQLPKGSKLGKPKVHMPKNGKGLKVDAQKIAGAVTDAAKRADQIGQRVSSVANSVQKVGETAGDAAKKA